MDVEAGGKLDVEFGLKAKAKCKANAVGFVGRC